MTNSWFYYQNARYYKDIYNVQINLKRKSTSAPIWLNEDKNGFVLHQMDQWIHSENIDQLVQANTCTTSIPFTTLPKTVCLLSNHGVATVVIKNWEPLVFGPALAMETVKGLSCLKLQETEENILDINIKVSLKNHSKWSRSYFCNLI